MIVAHPATKWRHAVAMGVTPMEHESHPSSKSRRDDRNHRAINLCRPFGASRSCWFSHPRVCTRGYNMPSLRD